MKEYFKNLMEHPKTTLSGVVVFALVGLYLAGYISETQLTVAGTTLVAYGMLSSADAKEKD